MVRGTEYGAWNCHNLPLQEQGINTSCSQHLYLGRVVRVFIWKCCSFGNVSSGYHSIYQVIFVLIFRLLLNKSLFFHQPIFHLFILYRVFFGERNGTPLQPSCLENPIDGGAWWAAVHGVAKSRTRLSDFTFTFHFHALEKEMATHSSVLAWRIPGTGEPGGLPSMGSHRVIHD